MDTPKMASRVPSSLLFLIIGCCQLLLTASETYYVTTGSLCPVQPSKSCLSLSQLLSAEYIWNSSSNLTLIFLPGNHNLQSELLIKNMSELHISGYSNNSTTIRCGQLTRLSFKGLGLVHINRLKFTECSGNKAESVWQLAIEDSMFTGGENSSGAAAAVFELVNTNAVIINTFFVFNGNGSYRGPIGFLQLYSLQAPTSGVNIYAFVGGALIATQSNVTITGSYFEGNRAQIGGAIFIEKGSMITVSNSSFINNHAFYSHTPYIGGAIYCENSPYDSTNTTSTTVFITDTNFINNLAYSQGGALVAFNNYLAVHNCTFVGNYAAALGGAISIKNARMTVYESRFNHNTLHNLQSLGGGALALDQSIINITTSHFDSNSAWQGGVLYAVSQTNLTITDSQFRNNAAQAYGGVISASLQCFAIIERSRITNNTAQRQGGVVEAKYLTRIIILDSILQNNTASELGGVVSIVYHCQLFVSNSQFYANTAEIGGVVFSQYSTVYVDSSYFYSNSADMFGGVFHIEVSSNISITENRFENNGALDGGIATARAYCTFIIVNSTVINATANYGGAVNMVDHCITFVKGSLFRECKASEFGGAINVRFLSGLHIQDSIFDSNEAEVDGGSVFTGNHSFSLVNGSQFIGCKVQRGGAIHAQTHSIIVIQRSELNSSSAKLGGGAVYINTGSEVQLKTIQFHNNNARYGGGVLHTDTASNVTIEDCAFLENSASWGSTVLAFISVLTVANSNFSQNYANIGTLYLIRCTVYFYGTTKVSYNNGSLYMVNTVAHFMGTAFFTWNTPNLEQTSSILQEGGALTLFQITIYFHGRIIFENNRAESGGAIYAIDSQIFVRTDIVIATNEALQHGGGIYLYRSDLRCENGSTNLQENKAVKKGGGIYAISSSVQVFFYRESQHPQQSLYLVQNLASTGGGLHLEANAKLYIWKYGYQLNNNTVTSNVVVFANNSADFGGAIFVADSTNVGTCESKIYAVTKAKYTGAIECFVQILDVQLVVNPEYKLTDFLFEHNSANYSGSTLFGGLLDRCIANPFAEVYFTNTLTSSVAEVINGISYLRYISTIQLDSISSYPVQVCFCEEEVPNCSYQPPKQKVMKGETFTLTLVAVDQVNHTVSNTTIHTYTTFPESGLGDGQLIQKTGSQCTDLVFSITTIHDHEQLVLYADGPCKDARMSQGLVSVEFLPCKCPVGFQQEENDETDCICECASEIKPYVSDCDQYSEMVTKDTNSWISYINDTDISSGYLIYLHCPFDYCTPPTSDHGIMINLNEEDGADAQCAHNRAGKLCGSCHPGFSLSLGSSRCISCPHWHVYLPIIIMAAIVAGIFLVASLLVLNLTVAIGTPNGIIFYANIVAANRSTFLPFSTPNFVTIFIAWLNLDFGFDTCFIKEMDSFWKFWVELCFPAYLIFLVIVVIIVSEWSPRFAGLIGRKNPVATLATLILLSYAKLLRLIIAAFSFAILKYPGGSQELVWLLDGTVGYLSGKHIALFIAALLILLAGSAYTMILFLWQWILRCQNNIIFRWARNQQLCHFLEPYHAPYIFQHRYWTGLFLVLRVILYTIAAVNVSSDPAINLLAIGGSMTSILILKGYFKGNRIYKKWPIEILDMISYLNITLFSITSYYFLGSGSSHHQETVAYLSVSVTLALFVVMLLYHLVSEFLLKSRLWNTWRQRCYLPVAHTAVTINDGSESEADGTSNSESDSDNDQTALIAAPTTTVIDAPPRGEQPLSALVAAGVSEAAVTRL